MLFLYLLSPYLNFEFSLFGIGFKFNTLVTVAVQIRFCILVLVLGFELFDLDLSMKGLICSWLLEWRTQGSHGVRIAPEVLNLG